jgi:hypothetical protein
MASRQQWFETLGLSISQEHGKGWSVREIGATARNPIGRAQLTRIWEDRTRSSVVMALAWKATNASAIVAGSVLWSGVNPETCVLICKTTGTQVDND